MVKLGVVGSRKYNNLDNVEKVILYILAYSNVDWFKEKYGDGFVVISGGAKGVDSKAREVCEKYNIDFVEYKPDFSEGYNVRKHHERNEKIIQESNIILTFWDGKSRGTKSVIEKATFKYRKPTFVFDDKPLDSFMLLL